MTSLITKTAVISTDANINFTEQPPLIQKAPIGSGWASGKFLYLNDDAGNSGNKTLYSSNDGINWTSEIVINESQGIPLSSSILVDSNANTYVIWFISGNPGVFYITFKSTEIGGWSTPETYNFPYAMADQGDMHLCLDSNNLIHGTVSVEDAVGYGSYIAYFRRNSLNDWLFEIVTQVTDNSTLFAQGLLKIAIDTLGFAHLFYDIEIIGFSNKEIGYATNKTGSWLTDYGIGDYPGRGNWQTSYDFCIDSQNNIHFLFGTQNPDNSAIESLYYIKKLVNTGQGAGYSTPVFLDTQDPNGGGPKFDLCYIICHTDDSISIIWTVYQTSTDSFLFKIKRVISGIVQSTVTLDSIPSEGLNNYSYIGDAIGARFPSSLLPTTTDAYYLYYQLGAGEDQNTQQAWFVDININAVDDSFIPEGYIPVNGVGVCKYLANGQVRKLVAAVGGLDHLNGQIVNIAADGGVANPSYATVNEGYITLLTPAATVHVGLPYTWTLQFLPLGGDGQTVNQGKDRKLYDVVLRVYKSLGGQFGKDTNQLFPINYKATENINSNTDDNVLYTGDLHGIGFESSVLNYWVPVLTGSQPVPFMLLAAIMRSEINEEK
jgi:hypothetical protein